jgi:integrase
MRRLRPHRGDHGQSEVYSKLGRVSPPLARRARTSMLSALQYLTPKGLLASHRAWFVERFGEPQPEHCVFPFGSPQSTAPDRPITDVSSGWDLVRSLAGVSCRLHDLRHTFCTRLAEAGVPESTMLALMGHMSRQMLERYSHIRMAAKRDAVAGITLRPKIENSQVVPVKVPVLAIQVPIQ